MKRNKCVICVFAHQQVLITARNLKTISYFVGVFPIESMNQFDGDKTRVNKRNIGITSVLLLRFYKTGSVSVLI